MDLTSVYVLHTRPFRNTSLLVDLFSEEKGRFSVVARSARGPKSRYKGQLQLFTPLLASWSGRSELKTLNMLELDGLPFRLNQQSLFCGFYLNELLTRLLQKEDAYPALFSFYQDALSSLASGDLIPAALRLFEKKLLESLGYGLPLLRESHSNNVILSDAYYLFSPGSGFTLAEKNSGGHVFLGADLIAIASENFTSTSVLQASKYLMRLALYPLLGDSPLHSRALF